jgi:hypothetical protein
MSDQCTCGSRVCSVCGLPKANDTSRHHHPWTEFEDDLLANRFQDFIRDTYVKHGRTPFAIRSRIYILLKKQIKLYQNGRS